MLALMVASFVKPIFFDYLHDYCYTLSFFVVFINILLKHFVFLFHCLSRCMFVNNCKSPENWQVAAIADQSFADGKWHKFGVYVTREMDNSVIQCQVDSSASTNIKINGSLASENDEILFLAGLPNSNQKQQLGGNSTCFPEVANLSGCIADLEINLVSSNGHVQRRNTSHTKQYGEVSAQCMEAKDSIVSISDKNSKILLVMKDNNRFNTLFEFQIRTRESRAFVGKIANQIVTALFFLEEGKIKVSARFEDVNGHKGDFVHMTSNGISLSNNHWHKVTFNVAMETRANLFINDELKAHYKIRKKLAPTTLKDAHEPESHVTLRFGRSARKYPSFIGCLRDVYVNNHLVNFSLHHSSKGISVGKCGNSFNNDWTSLREHKTRNTTRLRSTIDTFTNGKYFDSRANETTKEPLVSSHGSLNTSENILHTVTPNVKPHSKRDLGFKKSYSIVVALAVGLLIIVIVMAYILCGLKSRLQKCHKKQTTEENGDVEPNTTVEISDKDRHSFHPADCHFANTRVPGRDQQPPINFNLHSSITNRESSINNQENYRSARRLDQSPVKVWEERYLSHAAGKAAEANFLTVPISYYNNVHMHKTSIVRSKENLSANIDSIGPTIMPPLDECISFQKHGFTTELSNSNVDCGRRMAPDVSPQSPRRFNRVYSGHDSLPKPKKASSLSWAYGTRFIRHESSDTDCSDVDRVSRARPRNQMMDSGRVTVKPRQLKVLESSEDEQESRRAPNRNQVGRNRRLRTFTEETYKLYSLKEEERDFDLDQRRPFSANRLKVYCRDTYSVRGRNRSTSFTEAAVPYDDTVGISAQARTLDGYTSSCPESIHCLSEKEDKGLNIRRSKRLTTHYF